MLKPRLSFQYPTIDRALKSTIFFPIRIFFFSFLLILSHGSIAAADDDGDGTKTTKIGAIVDANSRIGKEQRIAMEIATQNFNNSTSAAKHEHKLVLHFKDLARTDPLQAAYAADELIKKEQVQVIVGMEAWHVAALVADVANRAQVPVLSLATTAITLPSAALRWPFLVQIASNGSEQVNCIAAIIQSYKWRRVIAIYEDDMYGGDSGMIALLSEALQSAGSEIEHRLVFPPFFSLSDPQRFVHKEVTKLLELGKQSRVFIVLHSSLPLSTHLFREAKQLGLVGRDSVWIITETVSSLLDSVNTSVISYMQGALGIQTYYSEDGQAFPDFKQHFQKNFRSEYREEDNSEPGIHALRAYDCIDTIAQAVQTLGTRNRTRKMLLESILSSNFKGLSGNIRFNDGELSQQFPIFRIVNVIGKRYNELGFWSSKFGFSESGVVNGSDNMQVWTDSVYWPGKLLNGIPKGWAMPTDAKRLKIGVPGKTSYEMFVKVVENSYGEKSYFGFCIDVFEEVVEVLDYALPYEFEPFYGSYDDLVLCVNNKTYDAIVGDVTILADRLKYVEFTQPFAPSGLSMIVPVKPDEDRAWMFIKPFTKEMWMLTGLVMIYTMLIVWFLEHQSNPEFRGPWKNQLSNALWFTFSSLFFSHREKIYSNYTRVVVVMWLFVVFVVTSSYTASLTSMLTVSRLEPTVTDIGFLRRSNAKVGCDGDSFVKSYLKNVLKFKEENIKDIGSQYDYPGEFESGNIKAAFLEVPYGFFFLKEHCNKYTVSGPTYVIGGWGFAFQKGSPIAIDVSKAILTISENGKLKELREKWSALSSGNCSDADSATKVDSLNLQSFCGLYLISGATSTICFLFFLLRLLKNYCHHTLETQGNNTSPNTRSLWSKMVSFARYFHNGGTRTPGRAPTIAGTRDVWSSTKWELVSPSEIEASRRPPDIEIPARTG